MADFDAFLVVAPPVIDGLEDDHPTLLVQSQPGGSVRVTHYALRAHRTSDNTWQQWEDTAIQLTNAPGGAINYDATSLRVQAKITS